MELTTFLGIAVGVAAVLVAMVLKEVPFTAFNNPAAMVVIFAGTLASVLNSFPGANLKSVGKLFGILFTTDKKLMKPVDAINMIFTAANEVRQGGLVAMDAKVGTYEDQSPFFAKGLRMLIDGQSDEVVRETLESELAAMEDRHSQGAAIFSQAGMYAPTLGVLGAVFGLIAAMQSLEDTDRMAHAVAAAFMATILGIFTGYVLWNPFANKLKMKSKKEVAVKEMMIAGLVEIYKSTNPAVIKDMLVSLLPEKEQAKVIGTR